ncbi:ankyrin repeat-containing domain protein, partial [Lactifluus subvellereus]
ILLECKADINAQTPEGLTPLHVASRFGSLEVAELLLGHGVDVNARDSAHSTPLHLASGNEATLLEQLGGLGPLGPFEQLGQHKLRQLGQFGQLWQFWLLGRPSLEVACLLLKHGADVDAKDHKGRTAFHFALSKGHNDIAKLLSGHGAE